MCFCGPAHERIEKPIIISDPLFNIKLHFWRWPESRLMFHWTMTHKRKIWTPEVLCLITCQYIDRCRISTSGQRRYVPVLLLSRACWNGAAVYLLSFSPPSIFTSVLALNESDCVILIPNMREISQFNPWKMDLNGFKGECRRAETFTALLTHSRLSAFSLQSCFMRVKAGAPVFKCLLPWGLLERLSRTVRRSSRIRGRGRCEEQKLYACEAMRLNGLQAVEVLD